MKDVFSTLKDSAAGLSGSTDTLSHQVFSVFDHGFFKLNDELLITNSEVVAWPGS